MRIDMKKNKGYEFKSFIVCLLNFIKYGNCSSYEYTGADPGIYFWGGGQTKVANRKLRAKPESRWRSARVSRAKPESRAPEN